MSTTERFLTEMKRSKTLRISIKKCLNAASSTSVFLFSLIEALFCESEAKLFKNVKWSDVSKSEEFQSWIENFINESVRFRENQIEQFSNLKGVLSSHLRNDQEFTEEDMSKLGENVIERATNPEKVVGCLRTLADSISELEGVQNDDFNTKLMTRKLTNLHNRIEDLQSKLKFKIFL